MIVKTFDEAALRQAAISLATQVQQGFMPDVVVGIKNGGYIVAEHMARLFPSHPLLLPVSRQRAGTAYKQPYKALLRHIPYICTDMLRLAEHYVRSRRQPAPTPFVANVEEISALKAVVALRETACNILIVDDAVDSGVTLLAVTQAVQAIANDSCVIKSAAITVTTDTPLVQPDFALYRHVLCRFPWSFDYKK